MTEVHHLSRQEARRIAVRAQLLAGERPTDLVAMVDHLTALPVDMTAAVAIAPDLVAWARMGAAYEPSDLDDALAGRDLYDDGNAIRPIADLPLHLADMAASPEWEGTRDWLEANELFRNEVLDILDADGPMLSRDVHATAQVPWRSSGWNVDRNVRMMLECLLGRGEVAINGREGNQRLWDLAERVYPSGTRGRAARGGQAGPRRTSPPRARHRPHEGNGPPRRADPRRRRGEPAVVEGVDGEWRVDPAQLDSRPVRRARSAACSRRSTRSSATGSGWRTSSSSSTSWRCTSRPRSAAGATSRCRSSTATGWSASSTPPPTARRVGCSSTPCTRTCPSRRR